MPRLRCPRCATIVELAEGAPRVCPACGFGSRTAAGPAPTPAVPVMARPSAAATPAGSSAAGAAGAAAGRRKGLVIAGVAVAVLVVAGLVVGALVWARAGPGSAHALSEGEARTRVQAGVHEAALAMGGSDPGGQLRKVDNRVTPKPDASSGSDASNPFGQLQAMHMTLEWGQDGATRMTVDAAQGPVTISLQVVCTDRQYVSYGGQAYVSRPTVGGTSPCEGLDHGALKNDSVPFDELDSSGAALDRRSDGSVVATMDDNGTHAVFTIDSSGRLTSVVADTPEGSWTMTYEYGTRGTITPPANAKLIPAEVQTGYATGSSQPVPVLSSPQQPPRADLELRVLGWADGPNATPQATFPLGVDGPQAAGGWTFEYQDADHDGKVTAGDSYTLTQDTASSDTADPGMQDYSSSPHVVLYDTVAHGEANSSPMGAPGLGTVVLALALLGSAALVRRR